MLSHLTFRAKIYRHKYRVNKRNLTYVKWAETNGMYQIFSSKMMKEVLLQEVILTFINFLIPFKNIFKSIINKGIILFYHANL